MNEDGLKKLEALKHSYISTFTTPSGKAVLEDLSTLGFVKTTTMPDNSDSHRLAYNEGKRVMFVRILNMMNLDVARLKEMVTAQEAQEEE